MKKDSKINLSPLDKLFTTEEQRQDNKLQRVIMQLLKSTKLQWISKLYFIELQRFILK